MVLLVFNSSLENRLEENQKKKKKHATRGNETVK